ncbi:hypothetical protein RIF29_19643 [Crotalaria pallida]|uniref:Uncharacterized protein n=1 Tax=Crotalaria pallida TaxID=3830 RepID=A0AAN9IBL4_CROPI
MFSHKNFEFTWNFPTCWTSTMSKLKIHQLFFFVGADLSDRISWTPFYRQIISLVKKKRCPTFCRTCIQDGLWTKQSSPRRSVLLLSASATIGIKLACK